MNCCRRASKKKWPKNVQEAFSREIRKLRRVNPQVAEYAIGLTYVETLLDLPWQEFTKDNFDLKKSKMCWIAITMG